MATNLVWHQHEINKSSRARAKNQKPGVIWLTGLSGSGKSTIANLLEKKLADDGKHTYLLDGDNVRHGLNGDLDFSDKDRVENIRRIGEVSKLFVDAGLIVITAFISPFKGERDYCRNLLADNEFIEVFIDTPLEECEKRDPKGLYQKARSGDIKDFTGIDSPYEAPLSPEITLEFADQSAQESAQQLFDQLKKKGFLD
jgi:adenylylsulfate kinase